MLRHTHIACVMNCNGDCLLRGTRYIFKYNYGWQVLPQFSPPKINWTWSQSCSQNTKCSSNVQLLFCCTPQRSTFFQLPSAAHSSTPLSFSYLLLHTPGLHFLPVTFCCTPQRSTFFQLPSAAHSSAPRSSCYLLLHTLALHVLLATFCCTL